MNPIIIHKETRSVFQLNVDGTFTNLTTGNTGALTKETAKDNFVVPIYANLLIQQNPLVLELIKTLQLTIEK
jgi:hypothetical protein